MHPTMTHLALHVADLDRSVRFYQHYCAMEVVHDREDGAGGRVSWLAEPGKASNFILVLISGGPGYFQKDGDYSHLGFALGSRAEVDEVARRGREDGVLAWEPQEEPYPVGYFCALQDPDGRFVEFSYGQPLGPGAPEK